MGGRSPSAARLLRASRRTDKLWKQFLPDEHGLAPYGQVCRSRARVTADGQTAYIALTGGRQPTASNPVYSFFYALDTSEKSCPLTNAEGDGDKPRPELERAEPPSLDFKASVQDDGKIDRVEFLYNHNGSQKRVGTDTTPDADGNYAVKFTPSGPGVYGLFAAAYDADGLRSESQIAAVTVSNQAPTISWVSPSNNSTSPRPQAHAHGARRRLGRQVSIVHFNAISSAISARTLRRRTGNYQIVGRTDQRHARVYAWATTTTACGAPRRSTSP